MEVGAGSGNLQCVPNTAAEGGACGTVATGLCRDAEALDPILQRLATLQEDDVRGNAALALGLMQDQAVVEPLRAILEASRHRPELFWRTSLALGLLGDD